MFELIKLYKHLHTAIFEQRISYKPLKMLVSKIILLGIISRVCIAGTSDKPDSGPNTAMKRLSTSSWAWRGSLAASWGLARTLEERSLLPWVEEQMEVVQSEWCLVIKNVKKKFLSLCLIWSHLCSLTIKKYIFSKIKPLERLPFSFLSAFFC